MCSSREYVYRLKAQSRIYTYHKYPSNRWTIDKNRDERLQAFLVFLFRTTVLVNSTSPLAEKDHI
jgi:hypothetical protein